MAENEAFEYNLRFPLNQIDDADIIDEVEVFSINRPDVCEILLTRHGKYVSAYMFNSEEQNWERRWHKVIFVNEIEHKSEVYPWYITDNNLLVIRNEDGFLFYQTTNSFDLELLAQDERFNDDLQWNNLDSCILFGKFYENQTYTGVMTRNKFKEINIHLIDPELNLIQSDVEPLCDLSKDFYDILCQKEFMDIQSIFLAPSRECSKEFICTRTSSKLNMFGFNAGNHLEHLFSINMTPDFIELSFETFLFGKYTQDTNYDMLQVNDLGWFLFQYNAAANQYEQLKYYPQFAENSTWDNEIIKTISKVKLARDHVAYTSPKGCSILSFDPNTKDWMEKLNLASIPINHRHSKLKAVLQANLVIIEQDNNYYWTNITKINLNKPSPRTKKSFKSEPTNSKIPEFLAEDETIRTELQLNQQFNHQLLDDVIDSTGKLSFMLPLIRIPNFMGLPIEMNVEYSQSATSCDSVLGYGWTMQKDCIFMRRFSVFDEGQQYILIFNGVALDMKRTHSENNVEFWKIANKTNVKISYVTQEQRWVITDDINKYVYGRSSDDRIGLEWTLCWNNWVGKGSDLNTLKQEVCCWNLIEIESKSGSKLRCHYDIVNENVHNTIFYTSATYLTQIEDSMGHSLTIHYGDKSKDEYTTLEKKDFDGNLRMGSIHTRFVSGYKLLTPEYKQDVRFCHEIKEGKRFLTSIEQGASSMQFTYQNSILNGIKFPNSSSLSFSYQKRSIDSLPSKIVAKKYEVQKLEQVTYGPGYIVLSYLQNSDDRLMLKVLNEDGTNMLCSADCKESADVFLPILGRSSVTSYQVFACPNFCAILLYHEDGKEMCLLNCRDKKWSDRPKHIQIGRDLEVKIGLDFYITYKQNGSCRVHQLQSDDKWSEIKIDTLFETKSFSILETFQQGFIAYDDDKFWLGYCRRNKWSYKQLIKQPGLVRDMEEALQIFDVSNELRSTCLSKFKSNMVQLFQNMMIIRSLDREDSLLLTNITILQLDGDYNVVQESNFSVPQDDLKNYKISLTGEKGLKFDVDYLTNADGKYALRVKSKSGISTAEQAGCTQYLQKHVGISLNVQKYNIVLHPNHFSCGTHKFVFNGAKWSSNEMTDSEFNGETVYIPASNKLALSKESKSDTFKIVDGNNTSVTKYDLHVKSVQDVRLCFDKYFVYRTNQLKICILDQENILFAQNLPADEFFSNWTAGNIFVTSCNDGSKPSSSNNKSTLTFRNMGFQKDFVCHPLVCEKVLKTQDYNQVTLYKYDSASAAIVGNSVFYRRSTIIPGGDSKISGHVECHIIDGKTIKKVFDSDGVLVREEESKVSPEERNSESHVLWDRNQRSPIVDCSLEMVKNEEISFIGFEDYEQVSTHWLYQENDVVRNGFSGSGKNFLRLSNKSQLHASFQPKVLDKCYVSTCWIRSDETLKVNENFGLFNAKIYSSEGFVTRILEGKIKSRHNDWCHIEIILDLNQLYEKPTKIDITVAALFNSTLDVDHIRFSPLNYNFKAHIYNAQSGLCTATILNNGTIDATLFDDYSRVRALITRDDQITKFEAYSHCAADTTTQLTIKPRRGIYESFSRSSFKDRWGIKTGASWKIGPGQIRHTGSSCDTLSFNNHDLLSHQMAVRFHYHLQTLHGKISFQWFDHKFILTRNEDSATLQHSEFIHDIPVRGEIVFVLLCHRICIWVEGDMVFESTCENSNIKFLAFEFEGDTFIQDLMLMIDPLVDFKHMNIVGNAVQELKVIDNNTVSLRQFIYDHLDRISFVTIWTQMQRLPGEKMIIFHKDFITNVERKNPDSIWSTGMLQGVSNLLNPTYEGYGYYQNVYEKNTLSEIKVSGQPGKVYSVQGNYSKIFGNNSGIQFLSNLFPSEDKYTQKVQNKANGVIDVSVYDSSNNCVAWFVKSTGIDNLLTTYEFDDKNRLIKRLPPIYHREALTHLQHKRWKSIHFTEEDKRLQHKWGKFITYDDAGRVILEITPDSGKVEYLYSSKGLLKFKIYNEACTICYSYNKYGKLESAGKLATQISRNELLNFLEIDSNLLPVEKKIQSIYKDGEIMGDAINLIERSQTSNEEHLIEEEYEFDQNGDLLAKRVNKEEARFKYEGQNYAQITYPFSFNGSDLKVTYKYNTQGRLVGIGTEDNPFKYFEYRYNHQGLLIAENHQPGEDHEFIREFEYNDIMLLTQAKDKFLTQKLSFDNESYGGLHYDGNLITKSTFEASWHDLCHQEKLRVHQKSFVTKSLAADKSKFFFNSLQKTGIIDELGRHSKTFYLNSNPELPMMCTSGEIGVSIAKTLTAKTFPTVYGHTYDYGHHEELIRAKYFTDASDESLKPLRVDTFANEIKEINEGMSRDIWKKLKDAKFIIEDNIHGDPKLAHGHLGASLIRSDLGKILESSDHSFAAYETPIQNLLLHFIGHKKLMTCKDFIEIFSKWHEPFFGEIQKKTTQENGKLIWNKLSAHDYIESKCIQALDQNFRQSLDKYKNVVPDIVRVLQEHSQKSLGKSPGDVESFDIDANGNHHKYYTGFQSYTLKYVEGSNRIDNIVKNNFPHEAYEMKHDPFGSVTRAMHKSIQGITYDPCNHRTKKICLVNGTVVTFDYDVKGERVAKRVHNEKGELTYEMLYFRDLKGRCLVDHEISYKDSKLEPDILVTAYIYGPKGLAGFIRRDKFYSVIKDHEDSIRLVIRDGEVVAAYDYMPYGQTMRKFECDREAHIVYKYTGQEWDEETGLYNYHSRLYDPEIGRFYQIDPKEQYASPYKYAGNSPISYYDPDGEFSLLNLATGICGAYLGMAAANGTFKFWKWDYKSSSTYAGMVTGFMAGVAFQPVLAAFIEGNVANIAISLIGGYLSGANSNNSLKCWEWDWKSPATYYTICTGATFALSLKSLPEQVMTFTREFTVWGKIGFYAVSIGSGLTMAYKNTAMLNQNAEMTEWNYNNFNTYYTFAHGFLGGFKIPLNMWENLNLDNRANRSNAFQMLGYSAAEMVIRYQLDQYRNTALKSMDFSDANSGLAFIISILTSVW